MLDEYIILKAKESTYTIGTIIKTILFSDYLQKNIQLFKKNSCYIIKINKNYFKNNIIAEQVSLGILYDYIEYFCNKLHLNHYTENDIIENIIFNNCTYKLFEMKNAIYEKFHSFLADNTMLNIDSFIIFGIYEYNELIYELIYDCINEIKAEEELEYFVDMIKFYINTEPNNFDRINIDIQSDGTYNYFDSNYNNISQNLIESFYEETLELSATHDEILLSILITNNPNEIIIHNINNAINIRLLRTLKVVFEKRIKLCSSDCKICRE